MLEFLSSFLILIFSFNLAVSNDTENSIVFEKLQENLPIISVTPAAFYLPEEILEEENSDNENPDTNKIETYNTESVKVIGNVSSVGVDHSPILIPCNEDPSLCNSVDPEIPVIPSPEPTLMDDNRPELIGPPEVIPIEPPKIIPTDPPIIPPHNPCHCSSNKDIVCLMYPCVEAY